MYLDFLSNLCNSKNKRLISLRIYFQIPDARMEHHPLNPDGPVGHLED